MTPVVVSTIDELLDAIRARCVDLEITFQTLDEVAGLPDRYAAKLLAPTPIKNLGEMSLGAVLGALALGVAVVVLTEDPEQAALMAKRWTKRKRPRRVTSASDAIRCVEPGRKRRQSLRNSEIKREI